MVAVIVRFTVKPEHVDALRGALTAVQELAIKAGCQRIVLLESQGDANTLVEYEVWESAEAHQAYVAALPKEQGAAMQAMLEGPPSVEYLSVIAGTTPNA